MPPRLRTVILAATLLLCSNGLAGSALGQTTLNVRMGWEGQVHPGRWNPLFVTLSDPNPRAVTLELHTPYDNYHTLAVGQTMTIGPQPQTFPLFVPLRYVSGEDLSVVVRDARTRKRLASMPSANARFQPPGMVNAAGQFFGISGKQTTLRAAMASIQGASLQTGFLDPEELPADPIGYDCLDLLILNAPNLSALSPEQQQAIADWVRAGGSLLTWPGDDPVPASSPILDLLPCRIGPPTVIEQPQDVLERAGLTRRFGKLPARELTPGPDARAVPLLGGDRVVCYRGRAGFGRVFVSPINLSALVFNNSTQSAKLWRTVLDGLVEKLPKEGKDGDAQRPQYDAMDEPSLREGAAVQAVGDLLGDVPGAGRFGFGYVAAVMLGMMVVVGPVDWFVLKKLGRQPWTWVTTSGWIALVTLGAIYAGHVFKSGELYYRTFQLVDQVDDAAVARIHMTALYSPRTAEYDVATPPESWWQPASPGDMYYYRRAVGSMVGFHQTYRGSRPEPMVVNVWNLRFLRGASARKEPALVKTDLKVVKSADGKTKLVGTVTNVGEAPLKNLAVRIKGEICVFAARAPSANRIEPGQTVTVDATLDPEVRPTDAVDPNDPRLRGYYPGYYGGPQVRPDAGRLWDAGANLAVRRSDAITHWLAERDDLACVYAEVDSPAPLAMLSGKQPIEQHWKVVRALVPLGRE